MMRKVLVPFDSSENAIRALQHAIQLAKREPSIELHIVRAFEPPTVRSEIDTPDETARNELRPAMALAQAAGVKFDSEIIVGPVAKVLVRYAQKKGCDGIVMDTRGGMGAMSNLVMGSVATKVIHLTKTTCHVGEIKFNRARRRRGGERSLRQAGNIRCDAPCC